MAPSHIGRQRSSIACTTCRSRRVKCDSKRPTCSACSASDRPCVYLHGEEKRKPPSKKYVEALLARIKILEREVAKCQQSHTITKPKATSNKQSIADSMNDMPSATSSKEPDPLGELIDTIGSLSMEDSGGVIYFGPQSNFLVDENLERLQSGVWSSFPNSVTEIQPRLPSGLSDQIQQHLVEMFFTWWNPWNYYVHKSRFMRELEQPGGNYCTSALLFAILSIASRFSDHVELRADPDDPNTAGDELLEKAKILLVREMEVPMLSTVATALIISMREMATGKDHLGWTYAGLGSRMAFSLGLHLDSVPLATTGKISKEDVEVRNITWWGTFMLEKLFTIGLGRPSAIADRNFLTPFPATLPDIEYEMWQPSPNENDIPPQLSHAISSVVCTYLVFLISSATLETICAPNSCLAKEDKKSLVSETYAKLTGFYNNLPSHLRLPSSARKSLPPHIYLMHIQYHTTVIQLHRPFLKRSMAESFGDLLSSCDLYHNQICTASAESISDILRAYKLYYSLRRIAISVVHCVGTSSIIHLFDATSKDLLVQRKALRLLRLNFNALQEMSVSFQWSKRMLHSLQALAKRWGVDEAQTYGQVSTDNVPQLPPAGGNEIVSKSLGMMALEPLVSGFESPRHRVSLPLDIDWPLSNEYFDYSEYTRQFEGIIDDF